MNALIAGEMPSEAVVRIRAETDSTRKLIADAGLREN
jgi:hypothetical protein